MEQIKVLPSEVYNKISAGEVVERPASVVKELVENAIDAGADNIKISIERGGIAAVSVTDNGKGIARADIKTAFLPHATSKISSSDDLKSIKTLGFRGEALPSIASVSKVRLITKTEQEDFAYGIYGEGGLFGDIEEIGGNNGTSITVSDLFYNTPARLKFLKKPANEAREVSALVAKLILANPNVSIKYTVDGETVYNSQGNGIENAFICVYGKDMFTNALKINAVYKRYLIEGYVGSPLFPKNNTTYQTLVINGRYVVNANISNAVKVAFKPYLMTRQYPYYVLYLTVPLDEIDVNVHPNKLEVRFVDNRSIFSAFYAPVSDVIKNEDKRILSVDGISFFGKKDEVSAEEFDNVTQESVHENEALATENAANELDTSAVESLDKDYKSDINGIQASSAFPLYSANYKKEIEYKNYGNIISQDDSIDKLYNESLKKGSDKQSFVQEKILTSKFTKVGYMFEAYIVLQSEDKRDIYLIDQHAAHERIIFDRLCDDFEHKKTVVQPLLIPYVFSVNTYEYDILNENLDFIRSSGFDISPFGGNAFRIDGLPAVLGDISPEKFVSALLESEDGLEHYTRFTKEVLARISCRSAVKAGDRLSDAQIDSIIEKLSENISLKCPHGRPIVLRITKSEIEKWFKRIV